MKLYNKPINWTYTIFFSMLPIIAIAGTIWWSVTGHYNTATILLTIFYVFATGMGITAGYHRLLSHKTYKAHPVIKFILLFFATATFQGSATEWCSDHVNHHRYVDTEKDPYNINQGFWYAHLGWILSLEPNKRDLSNVPELLDDKILRFQHKYFTQLAAISGFLIPALIASLWGDFWGGLLLAGVLRMCIVHHSTFFINSLAHTLGSKNYTEAGTARDNLLTALLTFGEGYHNFHHQFARDYRNGIKFYHYDPTKWLIKGLYKIGLASDLQVVSEDLIVKYKVAHDETTIESLFSNKEQYRDYFDRMMLPAKEAVVSAANKITELEKAYRNVLSSYDFKQALNESQAKLYELHIKIHNAKRELKYTMQMWKNLVKNSEKLVAISY